MELNNPPAGWDGKFKEKYVNPGVFTWIAKVRFIDTNVEMCTGDITVIR